MNTSKKRTMRAALASLCAALVVVAVVVGVSMQPRQSVQQDNPQAQSAVSAHVENPGTQPATSEEAPQAQNQTWTAPEGVIVPDYSNTEHVPGELLATPAEGVSSAQLADFLGASVIDDANGYVQLALPQGLSLEEATVKLQVEGLVESAQPNYVYHIQENEPTDLRTQTAEMLAAASLKTQAVTVNDPYLTDQWGLESIKAFDAWEKLSGVKDKAVTVAVIDEGFDRNHEDLKGNVVGWANVVGNTTFNPVADVSEEQSDRHGSHAAGIIAAQANNGKGVAGVGYNKVGLFLVKVYNKSAESGKQITTGTLVNAYNAILAKASEYKIRVINMSIGTDGMGVTGLSGSDQLVLTRIDEALNKNIITVCSAGNAGSQGPNYPGDYKNALAVIALKKDATYGVVRDRDSNYNPSGASSTYIREISAPGNNILSTVTSGFSNTYYDANTTSYGYLGGTSMAAPHVSAALALMFAADPTLTASEARSKLLSSATDVTYSKSGENAGTGPDIYTGYGEVNVDKALDDKATYITGDDVIGTAGKTTTTLTHKNTTGGTTTWSTSNSNVAKIASSDGNTATVEAVSAGSVTITAKTGDATSYRTINVFDPSIATGLTNGEVSIYANDSKSLVLGDSNPKGFAWTWKVADTTKATVSGTSASSTLTANKAGTTKLTVSLAWEPTISKTYTVTIAGANPKELKNASITGVSSSYTYTGSAIKPVGMRVTAADGTLLKEGTDYTASYANNTNVGTATITIKPAAGSAYKGSVTKTFIIAKSNIKNNGATVAYVPSQTYTGKSIKPKPTVKVGLTTLKEGKDFEYVWYNNKNVGTANLYVYGRNNYTDGIKNTFKITKANMANTIVKLDKTQYTYNGSAMRPGVTVTLNGITLPTSDYTISYKNNVNVGTATVTVTGKNNMTGSKSTTFKIVKGSSSNSGSKGNSGSGGSGGSNGSGSSNGNPAISNNFGVTYQTHVQNVGWQRWNSNGQTAGTSGRSLRLEAIKIMLPQHPYTGSIQYRTHVQNIGWQGWKSDGALAGTSGMSLRLEAIQIRLTGEMAKKYDVYYRVHAQNIGWMNWAKNGEQAGTAGYSYRLEAIQVKLVKKGSAAPTLSPAAVTGDAFRAPKIEYRTHVQNVGWQGFASDGSMSGTSGRSLRLEGINIRLGSQSGLTGHVRYKTHIQNIGWESSWRSDGAMSGTSGRALRLEAIRIQLEGDVAGKYDIYYRVHAQNFGWMDWAKNGQSAGTAGYGYRLEGIQIKLVKKDGAAPGSTAKPFRVRG